MSKRKPLNCNTKPIFNHDNGRSIKTTNIL